MVVLNIFHVLIAIAMVALVLVQRGAGATAGAAFGSGASGTVFGARGAGTFLSKSTWVLAVLFCAISLTMAVMVSRMDASPEVNLGVVSAAAEETGTVAEEMAAESGQEADENAQEDLPTLQVDEDQGGDAMIQQEQTDEDVPVLDGEAAESTDNNKGGTATGTDSDES
ncbi:MAG TPA: preprotein translocase subunit SecG [Xanthomonadales bacterium]|nr:preprotein translocase subunit SecG [Xanthomonadales bacterium]